MRLIDADAINLRYTIGMIADDGVVCVPLKDVCKSIDETPTIDAVPVVHAKWKLNRDGSGTCSNCRRTRSDVWDMDNWDNYCSHCGAKMDGEKE